MDQINPYESPQSPDDPPVSENRDDHDAARPTWRRQDFLFALGQQCFLLLLTALALDGGVSFKMCLTAAIAYWVGIVFMAVRRRTLPTKLDVVFVKFGFLFCVFLTFPVAFVIALIMSYD